jgi:hypothetical protein
MNKGPDFMVRAFAVCHHRDAQSEPRVPLWTTS